MFEEKIDVLEDALLHYSRAVLKLLLLDKTTKKYIIWATDDYYNIAVYSFEDEIRPESISGKYNQIIKPRVSKEKEQQQKRTRLHAEVFTPAWVCNIQNNLVDEAWFGRKYVFNRETDKGWITNYEKIVFNDCNKTWKHYVDARRMEIACGEAPYLVSRYDNAAGSSIELSDRIGLLDLKLRVVGENAKSQEEWLKWAKRAVESIYGFEYQGDNLIIARENVLYTYIDYFKSFLNRLSDLNEVKTILNIIAWNIWQMDGLTFKPPRRKLNTTNGQNLDAGPFCIIKDWRSNKAELFKNLAA